jgi:hypothetical protein
LPVAGAEGAAAATAGEEAVEEAVVREPAAVVWEAVVRELVPEQELVREPAAVVGGWRRVVVMVGEILIPLHTVGLTTTD